MTNLRRLARCAAAAALLFLPPARASAQTTVTPDAASPMFDDTVLHDVSLAINTRDLAILKANWQLNSYYPADLTVGDQKARGVAVRSRGGGSRNPVKLGLLVRFDRFDKSASFLGQKSVVLRNNTQDASNVRERVAMQFLRRMGMPASREAHARLFINGEFQGLYTLVETIDDPFVLSRFGVTDGRVYEYKFNDVAFVAGADPFVFNYLGPDSSLWQPDLFNPETFQSQVDPQGEVIGKLFQALNDPSPAWRTLVAPYLDLSKFVRELAIENYLGEEDGLMGDYGPNNFYLFRRASDTLFNIIPWDKSNTFWPDPGPNFEIFRNILDGIPSHHNLLALRVFNEPDLLNLYFDTLLECASADDGFLEAEVTRAENQIHDAALADPLKPFTNDQVEQDFVAMRAWAHDRAANVRRQVTDARAQ